MVQTYRSSYTTVQDGDTTSYSIPTSHTNISNFVVRWRSVVTETTTTDTVSNRNRNETLSQNTSSGVNYAEQATFPPQPNQGTFQKIQATGTIRNVSDSATADTFTGSISTPFGDSESSSSFGTAFAQVSSFDSADLDAVGNNAAAGGSYSGGNGLDIEVIAVATVTNTVQNTTTEKTTDPSVTVTETGDTVTTSVVLDENEVTSYRNISIDASADTVTFDHSIDGSQQADFQFKYDYEQPKPTPIYEVRVFETDTTYSLPLVSPTDPDLAFDALRTTVNGTIVSADLVDTTDVTASPVRVHTPQYGTLAWRDGNA